MEKSFYHGFAHRFCVRPFVGRDGVTVYMVHDANHVTDAEITAGHRSPVVAQFDTAAEARDWCDRVEAGKILSIPHESNFEGWPELRARVTGVSQGERCDEYKPGMVFGSCYGIVKLERPMIGEHTRWVCRNWECDIALWSEKLGAVEPVELLERLDDDFAG